MNCITIRFYGQLNYFLQSAHRQISFDHYFKEEPSVKDVIESLGVPHTEIGLLLIDGKSAGFSEKLYGGERVAVYPVFSSLDVSELSQVQPEPLSDFRFILDVHLGKLACYLRMLGFDTLYSNAASDEQLAYCSRTEKRILLTFDRGLLKRKEVAYGYCVRSREPIFQVSEVLSRYELFDFLSPFTRCIRCNGLLLPVPKEDVLSALPEKVRKAFDEFYKCEKCGHVYWKGSHYENMNAFISQIKDSASEDP